MKPNPRNPYHKPAGHHRQETAPTPIRNLPVAERFALMFGISHKLKIPCNHV
jgi:hypothetical protein